MSGSLANPTTGSDAWYAQLPQLSDFDNDVGKWLEAVKQYSITANGPPAFPGQPTADQMTAAYGPGWTAAGSGITPPSSGAYYSNLLNQEYLTQGQQPANGPSFAMRMQSRESVRPNEFQSAYNAVDPSTGNPLLMPEIGGGLEANYGYKPTTAYNPDGTAAAGSPAAVNPAGGTFFDPKSGQLLALADNPDPAAGFLEVPNNFDPNDPNAVHVRDAMGYIAMMATQGTLYGPGQAASWQYLHDILTPLGIDPAVFVAGVLNYNNYQIADDGTITQATGPFAGSTPGVPGTPPTSTLGAMTPSATGAPSGPNFSYTWPTQSPTQQPSQTVQPNVSAPGGPVERPKPESNAFPPGNANLAQSDPLAQGQPPNATQLAQQHGNVSTIDPRYPDWMLLYRPGSAQRGTVQF